MRKVFVLDDLRDARSAYQSAGLPVTSIETDTVIIARTFEAGLRMIYDHNPQDLWVLDHDLGCYDDLGREQTGYDFLKEIIKYLPYKLPSQVISCSASPAGRNKINNLFKHWQTFDYTRETIYGGAAQNTEVIEAIDDIDVRVYGLTIFGQRPAQKYNTTTWSERPLKL